MNLKLICYKPITNIYKIGCHPHINMSFLTSSCLVYRLYKICDRPVLVNNQPVQRIDARKCLGVLLDKKLSWEKHIETICKKAGAAFLDALSLFRNTLFTNYHGGMTQLVSHVWDISLLKEFNNYACFDSYFKCSKAKHHYI